MPLFGRPNVAKLEEKGNVRGLIKALTHEQAEVRIAAAQALGRLGNSEAVGPLISALLDRDTAVAVVAAQSLGEIGDAAAVEALVVTLHGRGVERRVAALHALGQIGTEPAIDGLVSVLQLEDEELDEQVALALAQGGAAQLPRLLAMLAGDQPRLQGAARSALRIIGAPAVQALAEMARGQDAAQAETAIRALGQIQSPLALQTLIPLLATGSYTTRALAQEALRSAGGAAVPVLVAALEGADQNAQRAIVQALGNTGQATAAPTLAALVADGPKPLARVAAQALGELGIDEAAPALLKALESEDWLLRQQAVEGLDKLEPTDAVRAGLATALLDRISAVRKAAVKAIDDHGWQPETSDALAAYRLAKQDWPGIAALGAEAIPALVQLIPSLLATERTSAVTELAKMGPPALAPLLSLLGHSDAGTRAAAAEGLGVLGDRQAVPPLLAELASSSGNSGAAAATALGLLGTVEAVGALEQAVLSGSATVRAAAAPALAHLGPEGEAALLALAQADNAYVVRAAISGLALVQSHEAAARLVALTLDERPEVQQEAIRAAVALGELSLAPAATLLHTGDSRARVIMADLLGALGDRRAESALLRAYWHPDAETSLAAARALAQLGAPKLAAQFDPERVDTLYMLTFARTTLSAPERQWLESEALADLAAANPALDRLHTQLAADQGRIVGDSVLVGPFGHNLVSMVALFKAWLQAHKVIITAWDGWFYHDEISLEGEGAINTAVLLYYRPRPTATPR